MGNSESIPVEKVEAQPNNLSNNKQSQRENVQQSTKFVQAIEQQNHQNTQVRRKSLDVQAGHKSSQLLQKLKRDQQIKKKDKKKKTLPPLVSCKKNIPDTIYMQHVQNNEQNETPPLKSMHQNQNQGIRGLGATIKQVGDKENAKKLGQQNLTECSSSKKSFQNNANVIFQQLEQQNDNNYERNYVQKRSKKFKINKAS